MKLAIKMLLLTALCCGSFAVSAEDPQFYVVTLGTGIPLPNLARDGTKIVP